MPKSRAPCRDSSTVINPDENPGGPTIEAQPGGSSSPGEASRPRLERGALVFLVACLVAAAGGGRVVLLTLQVLGYPVVLQHHPAGVAHGLQVGEDGAVTRQRPGLVGLELEVAVDAGLDHLAGAAVQPVLELDAAADPRALAQGNGPEALALHVADHAHAVGDERGPVLDLNGPLNFGAVERTRRVLRDAQVVHGPRAYGPPAHPLLGQRYRRHHRQGQKTRERSGHDPLDQRPLLFSACRQRPVGAGSAFARYAGVAPRTPSFATSDPRLHHN